jgi:hypothetical protein
MTRSSTIFTTLIIAALTLNGQIGLSMAASVDFGWGTPIEMPEKTKRNEVKKYLAWPVQISNSTGKKLNQQIDIVAVTNTRKQYTPVSNLRVKIRNRGEIVPLSSMQGGIFPRVIRKTIVIFKEIDPKATAIDFYVGGLSEGAEEGLNQKYFRITYKRSSSGWRWDGTSVLE